MKPLVIYHDNCADGFGAAFAAWMKLGDEVEYLPMQYKQSYDEFWRNEDNTFDSEFTILNREIYILDFSFPHWIMNGLFSLAKRVVWLDHHKTAFEMWCGKAPNDEFQSFFDPHDDASRKHYILLDNNKSGAMLAWEYFHPDTKVPVLIRCIDDYDRWQFKLSGTKESIKALWSYAPWTFKQWQRFLPIGDLDNLGELKKEGAAILRAHEQNVRSVVEGGARMCDIRLDAESRPDGTSFQGPWIYDPDVDLDVPWFHVEGLSANCPPHLASDVGHELANQSGTYGLLWYINKDGKCLCSLRSNGDYDVSTIAKAFGGGGHKNAAGFEIEITTLLGWIK